MSWPWLARVSRNIIILVIINIMIVIVIVIITLFDCAS